MIIAIIRTPQAAAQGRAAKGGLAEILEKISKK